MNDLQLLDNVEFRFALADSDEKFIKQLDIFLVPVLDKSDSQDRAVQDKVLEICAHLTTRIKSNIAVRLPLVALIGFFKVAVARPLVLDHCLAFIKIATIRSSHKECATNLPALIKGISKKNKSQQALIFSIILPILSKYKEQRVSATEPPIQDPLGFADNPQDALFIYKKLLDIMLFNNVAVVAEEARVNRWAKVSPGLSISALSFILNGQEPEWSVSRVELNAMKVNILRLLQTVSIFPERLLPEYKFLIFVVAASETNHEVISLGEDGLKRYIIPNYESKETVLKLYELYYGSIEPTAVDDKRLPGTLNLKLKVLSFLMKSQIATDQYPLIIDVSMDALLLSNHLRLRTSGMSFIHWVARMASQETMNTVASVFIKRLISAIVSEFHHENILCLAYCCIGLFVKRVHSTIEDFPNLLGSFFSSLISGSKNVRAAVQEALSLMVDAFKKRATIPAVRDDIMAKLYQYIQHVEHPVRYIAAKYANKLFPFTDIDARCICLIGSGDPKLEVREESRIGLTVPEYLESMAYESYAEMLPSLLELTTKLVRVYGNPTNVHSITGIKYVGSFIIESFGIVVEFIRALIIKLADPTAVIELGTLHDSKCHIDSAETIKALKVYLKSSFSDMATDTPRAIDHYAYFIKEGLTNPSSDAMLQAVTSSCLLELVSLSTYSFSDTFAKDTTWIQSLLYSYSFETRCNMAHVLGILSSHLEDVETKERFIPLYKSLLLKHGESTVFEVQQGTLLALSFIFSRIIQRYPEEWKAFISIENFEMYENALKIFASKDLLGTSQAVAEIGRVHIVSENILEQIEKGIKINNESKIQENLIFAYGHCGLSGNRTRIIDFLLSLDDMFGKSLDTYFLIGEALATIISGWNATNMIYFKDMDIEYKFHGEQLINYVLEKCFTASDGSLVKRKAVAVWLLCICQYCCEVSALLEYHLRLHDLFIKLMTDKDEFVQEVASRGISLVYDFSTPEVRPQLIASLTSIIRFGKHTIESGLIIGADEKVSENVAAMGSMSTYQSILSLAAEMNQPELVYKLIFLTTQSSIWTSKRTGSFGFSWKGLQDIPVSTLPKIYRMRYDPNVKIAFAMQNLWKKVKRDIPFDDLIRELIKCTTDKSWNIRESSCSGLSELIPTCTLAEVLPFLTSLWESCTRASDDIKESVRLAGEKTCVALSKQILTWCDIDPAKVGQIMIPYFVETPVNAQALVKLVKKMGRHVENYVDLVVPYLIESMISNTALNYVSFHVASEGKEVVDDIRKLNVLKSEKMECIRTCVSHCKDVNSLVQKVVVCRGGSETKIAISLTIQQICTIGKVDRADIIIKRFIDDPLAIAALFSHLKNIEAFLDYLGEQIFEKDMSEIYHQLIKKNRDYLSSYAEKIMFALVYGIHSSKSWNDVYDAFGVPLSYHVQSIQDWCMKTLERPEWTTKAVIGKCLSFIVPHLKSYNHLSGLTTSLSSKTFIGKEELVKAYVETCKKFKLDSSYASPLIKECKKKDLDYKRLIVPICCECIHELKWNVFTDIKEALLEYSDVDECITGLAMCWNTSFSEFNHVIEQLYNEKFKDEKFRKAVFLGLAYFPIWNLILLGMKEPSIPMRDLVIRACEKALDSSPIELKPLLKFQVPVWLATENSPQLVHALNQLNAKLI